MSDVDKNFASLDKKAQDVWNRFAGQSGATTPKIFVGTATCGRASGALSVISAIKEEISKNKITADIVEVGCIGMCYIEPIVDIQKPPLPRISFCNVSPEFGRRLVREFLALGKIPKENILGVFSKENFNGIASIFAHPMLKSQVRIVLKNCGYIDPLKIEHYIANDGYLGLSKALKMKPPEVIQEVNNSGLRGRGGAGFPTARKWNFCASQKEKERYLICNGDEGDPGAFMNRSLIEGDPHSLIEGMLIAGYAIGARQGFIYIRAEYPLAIQRLKIAQKQATEWGLLGNNILGSGFSFDIEIREGAGAFVCGEETGLIQSLEGKRGMPRSRPPYPAISGFRGKPTVINNVETLSTLPHIIRNGAKWFAQYGTQNSKGTKTFSLVGKINRTGLIEVPLGTTLRQIIYDIGGGIAQDKEFKAIQTGGPSGGCIPKEKLDLPVDYESLTSAGSIMGSGGMIVMDEDTCVVDIAHYFLDFTQKESCGKCVPCRVGTRHMVEILKKIKMGNAKEEDLSALQRIANLVKAGSLCGLGQTAPNPVITTMKYFWDEYKSHIENKTCPALVCKELICYFIDPDKCVGCLLCKKSCPALAISGELKKVHTINQSKCTKCGVCMDTCPEKISAVIKYSGKKNAKPYN
jgi:NADH:ubiquinone oxidoreductase subunit F (NADH-binding)